MPLDKQVIDIPFGGIETKIDPKLLPSGKLIDLQNGDFRAPGSISKRNGYAVYNRTVTGLQTISAAAHIMPYRDELLLLDGVAAYSRMQDTTAPIWKRRGYALPHQVETKLVSLGSGDTRTWTADICYTATYYGPAVFVAYTRVTAYTNLTLQETDFSVCVVAYHALTGAVLMTENILASVSMPGCDYPVRLVVATSGAVCAVYVSASGTITVQPFSNSNGNITAGSPFNITDAITGAGPIFDCCTLPTGGALIAYRSTGTNKTTVRKFTESGLTGSTVTSTRDFDKSIAIDYQLDPSNATPYFFVVGGSTSGTEGIYELKGNYSTMVIVTTVAIKMTISTLGYNLGFVTDKSGGTARNVVYNVIATATVWGYTAFHNTVVTESSTTLGYGFTPVSKPWIDNSVLYVHAIGPNITYYTLAYTNRDGRFEVSHWYDDLASSYYAAQSDGSRLVPRNHTPNVASLGGSVYRAVVPVSTSFQLSDGTDGVRIGAMTLTLLPSHANAWTLPPGGPALWANGQVSMYDRDSFCEAGFVEHPLPLSTTNYVTGGHLSNGTYSVQWCFAWQDAIGDIHYGPLSDPITVTLAGGGSVQSFDVVVTTLPDTAKQNVDVIVFRTANNGSLYYQCGYGASVTTTLSGPLKVTVTVTESDATLIGQRAIYTAGSILENEAPPPATSAVVLRDRVYLYVGDDTIWYSKHYTPGLGLGFSSALTKRINPDNGSRVVLSEMDGAVVIFRERSIQYFNGDGPADTGGDGFSAIQVVASDVGALPGTPVVKTDQGIFFKSVRGICLLDRSFQVRYIGAPVESYNSLTLVSAALVAAKNQVRFGHSDGSLLVYDYLVEQWDVDSNHTMVDACMFQSLYSWVTSAGVVSQQATTYTDNASSIGLVVETAWIHLAGIQGFKRIWYVNILGTYKSAHTLTLVVYLDYATAAVETLTFDASTGYTAGDPIQIRHHIGHQCQAVKFKIYDSAQAGTKESLSLTGLSIEAGMKKGAFRLPAAKTI